MVKFLNYRYLLITYNMSIRDNEKKIVLVALQNFVKLFSEKNIPDNQYLKKIINKKISIYIYIIQKRFLS